jgi:hypothetical protein
MGRYPKGFPEDKKQELIKLHKQLRQIRWLLNKGTGTRGYKSLDRRFRAIKDLELIKKETEEKIKEKHRNYRINHRIELIEKQKERNLGALGTTNLTTKSDIDYEYARLGLNRFRQVAHATTKEELERARKQLGNQKKYKEKATKSNQAVRYTDEEEGEDDSFPLFDFVSIGLVFMISFMLAVISARYGVNLFSLFGQVF